MESEPAPSGVHNVVSGRVDGPVTMAHTIGSMVHGLPWPRVVLVVLAILIPAFSILLLAGYTVYRAITPLPPTTVVSVVPAPPSAALPSTSATTPPTTTATSAAPDPVARVVLPVATTTIRPAANAPAPTTTAPTTTAPTTSRPDEPTATTTTTSAAGQQCTGNPPWLNCVP
ncbi:hypothetical protein IOD16_05340 [Saccharothrix sp. 6-C]|uniref:hypothetical protein n=1 Tax=Saccharothrix sp. 6-C TaxID=2781735 RepID=UPI0019177016|nr:hypothetical protein [Saccharothrix sp. 6-C]QQQ77917.1 hypothetical protein IOD16_05340 [Saccharothrix sp. 6-C]